jgi:hypothetical protein
VSASAHRPALGGGLFWFMMGVVHERTTTDSEAVAKEVKALIARIEEAWEAEEVPGPRSLFEYEFSDASQLTYEDKDAYEIVSGRRFDEVDCEALKTGFGILAWLSNEAGAYYLGAICLCDLKNYFGPLDLECQAMEAMNLYCNRAHDQAKVPFTAKQAEAFQGYVSLFEKTRPNWFSEESLVELSKWLASEQVRDRG